VGKRVWGKVELAGEGEAEEGGVELSWLILAKKGHRLGFAQLDEYPVVLCVAVCCSVLQ